MAISPDAWPASQHWLTRPRRDLYVYVSAQSAPVSRDQASDALGVARHTAKFHLDKLAEEGLLQISAAF